MITNRREAMPILAAPVIALALGGARGEPNGPADFDFVVAKITANYAGFESKVSADPAAYAAHTAACRSQAASATASDLGPILTKWIDFFADLHTQIFPSSSQTPARKPPSLPWTESTVRRKLAGRPPRTGSLEGIWQLGSGRYRVGILQSNTGPDNLTAVVLSTTADGWQPGQIKARLRRASPTKIDVVLYDGAHAASTARASVEMGGALLDLGVQNGAPWIREWPGPPDPSLVERQFPPEAFFLRPLSAETTWLRFANFFDSSAGDVVRLVEELNERYRSAPNVVLDIRRNHGGSDYVYSPLTPLLYTRPIYVIGAELRATPDNIILRNALAKNLERDAPAQALEIRREVERMKQSLGRFVGQDEKPFRIETHRGSSSFPRQVALLLDSAGSTAEQFILQARQSTKVTTFGVNNSAGVLDYANVVSLPSPSGAFIVQWATSRSLRLPEDPVDPNGIAPDIRIPRSEQDPVAFAQKWLERRPA